MTTPDSNPTFAAETLLLAAIAVVLIGFGAILAIVLRRGQRLRQRAEREHPASEPSPGAWYEAGKRASADDFEAPEDTSPERDPDDHREPPP